VKDKAIAGIVMASALVLCLLGLLLLPSLQDAEASAQTEASEHVERARRLLQKYSATVGQTSAILDELREMEVDVDIEDPDELLEYAEDDYEDQFEAAWEDYNANGSRPRIPQGVAASKELIRENAALLGSALQAVKEALRVAPSHAEAHRLEGVIYYEMGLADSLLAQSIRRQADPLRLKLVSLATGIRLSEGSTTLVEKSGIQSMIADLKERAVEVESKIAKDEAALAESESVITELEGRIADARSRAGDARAVLDELGSAGIDFSRPAGAEEFADSYREADAAHRKALREIQALERGSYPQAKIDRSGDYVTGRYIENGSSDDLTVDLGLAHYRDERAILAVRLESTRQELDGVRSDLIRLEGIKDRHSASQGLAIESIAKTRDRGEEIYDELLRIESEAEVKEDEALDKLDRSARASQQAARSAADWVREASEHTRDLPPEVSHLSAYEQRKDDDWMSGYVYAQEADAHLAKAWVYLSRYTSALRDEAALRGSLESLRLLEADPADDKELAEEAHEMGLAAVLAAQEALQKAHRSTGRHWTITAQSAGTTYLIVLFGDEGYLRDTILGYRSALEGREDQAFTAKIAARLRSLEAR